MRTGVMRKFSVFGLKHFSEGIALNEANSSGVLEPKRL